MPSSRTLIQSLENQSNRTPSFKRDIDNIDIPLAIVNFVIIRDIILDNQRGICFIYWIFNRTRVQLDKDEVIRFLYARHSTGMKLGLKHIQDLLQDLGDPQNRFKSIHIAGTNGKGSCAAMLESILRSAGYRTGLYTSPHLIRPEERIKISGRDMEEKAFLELIWSMKALAEKHDASFFEILTAAGFRHFADEKVDVAVVETGLGGRLDATNTMLPVLSMITEIGLDHTEILGEEIQSIAMEKAGILKPGIPFICNTKNPKMRLFFRQYASTHQVPMVSAAEHVKIRRIRMDSGGTTMDSRIGTWSLKDLYLRLAGRHQVDNAAGVLAAIGRLRDSGWDIPDEAVRTGLDGVRWPARLDLLQKSPGILLDSAHNPPGMKKLAEALQTLFKYDRLILLVGVLSDKDYGKMAGIIVPQAQHVVLARPLTERGLDPAVLSRLPVMKNKSVEVIGDIGSAFARSLELAGPRDLICATGSIYLVGEVLRIFRKEPSPVMPF